ncbi:MAG: GNAT family N-acetyltransferase [Planctomycetes bacterium]|nr:GNAT family N-acetyltransferase [Planctomycetota bacterium]
MAVISLPAVTQELERIFGTQQRLKVRFVDLEVYQRFRSMECGLVSCLDGQTGPDPQRPQVLAIALHDKPVGVVSFLVSTNAYKQSSSNLYGRIDLVIMSSHSRGLGIGRLLVLSAITQLLALYGRRLYSLSSLAAHPAMEVILEGVGFSGEYRQNDNFKHEELQLEDADRNGLITFFREKTAEALQASNFRLRQACKHG